MDNSVTEHKHGGMKQLPATAICGNDITSSCLYVSALAIIYSGRWAPIVLLFVAGVLFMFIGSPGNHFMHGLSELGGVRLII